MNKETVEKIMDRVYVLTLAGAALAYAWLTSPQSAAERSAVAANQGVAELHKAVQDYAKQVDQRFAAIEGKKDTVQK